MDPAWVPCRDRCGVFAGEDGADGLEVDGAVGGDSQCRGKLGFGYAIREDMPGIVPLPLPDG